MTHTADTPTDRDLQARLNTYRERRACIDDDVMDAVAHRWTQARIARESGLSREGVRKIIDRKSREDTMARTARYDMTGVNDLFDRVDRIKAAVVAHAEKTGEDPSAVIDRLFAESVRRAELDLPPT